MCAVISGGGGGRGEGFMRNLSKLRITVYDTGFVISEDSLLRLLRWIAVEDFVV